MATVGYLAIGIVAGIFGGLLGIGGGTIVVPSLVYFFHMTQHKAQGTILAAFLPPVALLAVMRYYKAGNVDLVAAAVIAVGLLIGGYYGAGLSLSIPEVTLKKIFGIFLLVLSVQYIFAK